MMDKKKFYPFPGQIVKGTRKRRSNKYSFFRFSNWEEPFFEGTARSQMGEIFYNVKPI